MTFFRYNYKLSIIEDVYNVLKNNGSFAIRVWFGLTPPPPPPQLWSKTIKLPFFFGGPFPNGSEEQILN